MPPHAMNLNEKNELTISVFISCHFDERISFYNKRLLSLTGVKLSSGDENKLSVVSKFNSQSFHLTLNPQEALRATTINALT